MIHKSLLLAATFFISACSMSTHLSSTQSFNVEYMQTANALSDAKKAISQGDFTLIGFDRRGLVIPGVELVRVSAIQKNCTVQRVIGMGDVVRSPKHLKKMQKVQAYSKAYNLEILNATSCDKH